MESHNDGWIYSGSAMERLWNKSAIGKKINNNQLLLSSSEVIFCHNHRHLDWPSEEWLGEEIDKNPNLINESIIIEALSPKDTALESTHTASYLCRGQVP